MLKVAISLKSCTQTEIMMISLN